MDGFEEIAAPPAPKTLPSASLLQAGPPIEPISRLMVYTPDQWEEFIDEWVSGVLKANYSSVRRFTGANDRGIDIAGFADAAMLSGEWDLYQCKRFQGSVSPSAAWPEIGKVLWHSFQGHYKAPRAYYFMAPKGIGTTLNQLLAHAQNLKARVKKEWDKNIAGAITGTATIALDGAFASYVDAFDFSIFKSISPRELIDQHRATPYFLSRFGGALPARPKPGGPPEDIQDNEQTYVGHLLAAYGDHTKQPVADVAALAQWTPLREHFRRSRESFYHAESLRVFVREKVEPGTFETLQDEIYDGVIDTVDGQHTDGLERVKAAVKAAQDMSLDAHPLGASALTKDRHGICHQLANEDRLTWTK